MNSCWAECLGGCGQKISREHLVSKSLFQGTKVRVQGFPWCKDQAQEIGLGNLTAKILCTTHNSDLSPVDMAGSAVFDTLREMTRLSNVRRQMKPRAWKIVRRTVDGHLLERWFLKTLINICWDGEYPIGRTSGVTGKPSDLLVRIAYGTATFQNRAGLYSIVRPGMRIDSNDTVTFCPLIRNGLHIESGLFSFRGWHFLLSLEAEGPPVPLTGIQFQGEDLGQAQLNFHNEEARENTGRYCSQVLKVKW